MPKNMEGKEKQNQQWYQIKVFVAVQSLSHVQLLQPHELQDTRHFYPSLSPRVCSISGPLNWWCHPTISSSVTHFSSCPQSFPASGTFQVNWLFPSGGQIIGISASASVLPVNTQGWFPLGLTVLIFWQSKGLSRVFPTIWKHKSFSMQLSLWSNSHICTWKNHSFDYMDLCRQVMSLLFNMLPRFVIAFLLRSKHLLTSWLQSPFAMIWEPKKKICQCFHFFPFYLLWSDGTRCHYLSFLNTEFLSQLFKSLLSL